MNTISHKLKKFYHNNIHHLTFWGIDLVIITSVIILLALMYIL